MCPAASFSMLTPSVTTQKAHLTTFLNPFLTGLYGSLWTVQHFRFFANTQNKMKIHHHQKNNEIAIADTSKVNKHFFISHVFRRALTPLRHGAPSYSFHKGSRRRTLNGIRHALTKLFHLLYLSEGGLEK